MASFPNAEQTHQFLAAPLIPYGTGLSMTRALVDVIHEWEIPFDHIIGMSWDTTASNTGRLQGSSILFEQELEHADTTLVSYM